MRKLQIQVMTRDGQKNIYETDRLQNVADLKKHIGRNMNVPMGFSKLTYKGRLLTNDCILEDEGVKSMSTLELCWQPLVLTPQQYSQKELELDMLEQTGKKNGHDRIPSGVRCERDHVRVKPSLCLGEVNLTNSTLGQQSDRQKDEECIPVDLSSSSSDEVDFPTYWCCTKSAVKQSGKTLDINALQCVDADADVGVDANQREDVQKLNDCCICDPNNSGNLPRNADLMHDIFLF
ncbi:uncharacterized protein LOC6564917 [Drosophila grimshawi]|uniref:GH12233 n=1 Tax=Drosophila grimshawi TaxID=7222 RepID=B4JJK7_DROGR|nr:uncharacterized protein LOC6564917 [Drosophila grimshawi]EDV99759.1 GH12233 [Drosophila grimshawi]